MGRADPTFLGRYACAVAAAGASRLRLSDTVGCLAPERVTSIVKGIRRDSDIPLQLHMHNDFGLAIANVLAGIQAGAEQVHTTINGLGERAGITSFHAAAVAIEVLLGMHTGIRLNKIPDLSALVASFTKFTIAHNEPIVGSNVFTHESGIHVNGMLHLAASFQPFDPVLVGRSHEFVLGKHTGSQAICHILSTGGVEVTRVEAKEMLPNFRDLAIALGGCVPPEVACLFARQFISSRKSPTSD